MLSRHWADAALSVSGSLQDLQTSSSTTVRCIANCDSIFVVVIVRGPLLAGRHICFHFSKSFLQPPVPILQFIYLATTTVRILIISQFDRIPFLYRNHRCPWTGRMYFIAAQSKQRRWSRIFFTTVDIAVTTKRLGTENNHFINSRCQTSLLINDLQYTIVSQIQLRLHGYLYI